MTGDLVTFSVSLSVLLGESVGSPFDVDTFLLLACFWVPFIVMPLESTTSSGSCGRERTEDPGDNEGDAENSRILPRAGLAFQDVIRN